ncbi:putative nuclease HARBI1 [Centruroides vittatus]|uniref:putative nuclease HARBI1 n=1 Tax=Centruroides vittatus TaxID=120091 RepID=UPI00350FE63F
MDILNLIHLANGTNREHYSSRQLRRERVMRDRNNPMEIYSEDEFRIRYRFSKSGFVRILNRIGDEIKHLDGRGLPLTTEQQLLTALRFYATGSYRRVAGDLIGVHVSTVCRTIQNVSKALVHLKNAEIVFPTESELTSVKHDFSVICDGKMKIRNIVARWPGSTHDGRIFSNGSIKEKLHRGYCNGYLVGDGGYPCLPYLTTPFLHPQNRGERRYNKAHSRARNIVERLFGVWKRRFPCMGSCLRTKLDNTLNIIIATAILHNWAIDFKEEEFLIEHSNEEREEECSTMNEQSSSGSALRRSIVPQHFT